jgi:suppressor for copper-sensitivity B
MYIMRTPVKAWLVGAALLAAGTAGAEPGASPWAGMAETRARLVAATAAVGEAPSVSLGLEIELAPGWKTYWRSPGESGAPPRLDWSGSENLARVELAWPAPERFVAFDLESFGYADRVILPVTAWPVTPGQPLTARLTLDYQVCKDICIPVLAELSLALPAGQPAPTPHAGAVAAYRGLVPRPNGEAGIEIAPPRLVNEAGGRALLVTVTSVAPLAEPLLIVEAPPELPLGRVELLSAGPGGAQFRVPVSQVADTASVAGVELTLTLVSGGEAREARLAVAH